MFFDDIQLCREVAERHGPLPRPIIDVGGLTNPTIADYSVTIERMKTARTPEEIHAAQYARYQRITRPLSFLDPDYRIENPEEGGRMIEDLSEPIGTAVLLSVLEHVRSPFVAIRQLRGLMSTGGMFIVSVPFMFPYHPSPDDNWRFTPSGLRAVFEDVSNSAGHLRMKILECDWRLKIGADEGVLDIHTGRPQAIESCYVVAWAVG